MNFSNTPTCMETITAPPGRFLREAEEKRHDLLLDIDVQGAAQIKRKLPDAISIFVLPPDRKTLEWRLRKRSEDADEVITRRLITASREIENYDKYDYLLINDLLVESIDSLEAIVLSERLQHSDRSRLFPRKTRKPWIWRTVKARQYPGPECGRSLIPLVPYPFGTSLDFAVSF